MGTTIPTRTAFVGNQIPLSRFDPVAKNVLALVPLPTGTNADAGLIGTSTLLASAFGGWFAGTLYDHFATYSVAFGSGVIFNLANLVIVVMLVWRWKRPGRVRYALAGAAA